MISWLLKLHLIILFIYICSVTEYPIILTFSLIMATWSPIKETVRWKEKTSQSKDSYRQVIFMTVCVSPTVTAGKSEQQLHLRLPRPAHCLLGSPAAVTSPPGALSSYTRIRHWNWLTQFATLLSLCMFLKILYRCYLRCCLIVSK